MMMKKLALLVPFVLATPAAAQSYPQPEQILGAASQILTALDRNQAGQIWDGASPIMKAAVARARFIALVDQEHGKNGIVQGREWQSVNKLRMTNATPTVPAGTYVAVTFSGVSKSRAATRELLSFVLDADKVWRLVGYTAQ